MSTYLNEDSILGAEAAPGINIGEGFGQQGLLRSIQDWETSARYTRQPLIPKLLTIPPLFDYLPGTAKTQATKILKSLIEDRAISITGVTNTMTIEHAETVEGNSGEMRQTPTRTSRERIQPAYSWAELDRATVRRFWEWYATMFIGDPETQIARITTTDAYINAANKLPINEANQSFIVLLFEPTRNLDAVVNAAICANMMPTGTIGEGTMSLARGEAKEAPTVEMTFTSMSDPSNAAYVLAQETLDSINMAGLNPNSFPSFVDSVSADVAAAENGLIELADNANT